MPLSFLRRISLLLAVSCLFVLPAVPQLADSSPAALSAPSALAQRLDALWQREPLATRSFAGLIVADPESGETLYSRHASNLFVPASNAKLFSTALALVRLGPHYRLTTEVLAEGALDPASGLLRGNLVLRGGGDPSLSARRFPYTPESEDLRDYPIPALEQLADTVAAQGLRRITGDIIGDDSAYLWQPFHEGWAQDDALYEYGAPVSALSVNDNAIEITLLPGAEPGAPATLSVQPSLPYYDFLNHVVTQRNPARRVSWEIAPHHQILLRGTIAPGSRPWRASIAMDDPALYAARYFQDALLRRGIHIDGLAVARHRFDGQDDPPASPASPVPPTLSLARRESPALAEILRTTNKESVNLFAELLLLEVARVRTGNASRQGGIDELGRFLAELGIPPDAATLADGSGLARLSLVSPEATLRLLLAMWKSPHREVWLESLPLAGREGTLQRRLSNLPANGSVRAKSGTLRGVSALSGYATTPDGRSLAFSAFINNHPGAARAARDFLDKIALELVAPAPPGVP
jgi:D-alanyl-D-alanine carboxypeptidase/D-alanyl-D-alanine-endopeptidase (penicillin-binding protein 4)